MTRGTITRRGVLAGGAALAVSGCAGNPKPYDEAEVQELYPPIGKFVTVEGKRIHYWERGTGQPVILVHGASGNLRDWTFDIAGPLSESYRVIAFDRPGLGYSDRADEDGWHPAVQARLLRGAAANIGVEQPIVVGHSWGGALAMAWALDAPGETRGVVPVSAVTIPYGGLARFVQAIGLSEVIVDLYSTRLLERAREGGIEDFIQRVFRPQPVPEGYVDYVGAPLALRQDTLRHNAQDLQNVNIGLTEMAPRYSDLRVPVHILHGQADFIDWDGQAAPLAERLPNARLEVLPGIGHMAHHARRDALAEAIGRIVTV